MKIITLAVVWAVFLIPLWAHCGTEYYPLTPGVIYHYEVQASNGSDARQQQKLLAAVAHMNANTVEGKRVIPEKHYVNGEPAGVSFVADDNTGIYYYATRNASGSTEICNPAQYLIRYPVSVGTTWSQTAAEFDSLNNSKKIPVTLRASIESEDEIVAVPAGVFAKCVKIKMKGTARRTSAVNNAFFTIAKELWYAPGMGLIKLVQTEKRRDDATQKDASFTLILQLKKFQITG